MSELTTGLRVSAILAHQQIAGEGFAGAIMRATVKEATHSSRDRLGAELVDFLAQCGVPLSVLGPPVVVQFLGHLLQSHVGSARSTLASGATTLSPATLRSYRSHAARRGIACTGLRTLSSRTRSRITRSTTLFADTPSCVAREGSSPDRRRRSASLCSALASTSSRGCVRALAIVLWRPTYCASWSYASVCGRPRLGA